MRSACAGMATSSSSMRFTSGRDDIKTISVHHETVAGFMADCYYRVSGKPTATFTSCGPGSTNLPIALANAFSNSVPFLAVTGNIPTSQFNRGAFQELYRHYQADFPSTVGPCANACSSRRAAKWCRSRSARLGRPW